MFSYAALRHPEHALVIQRVLAIPPKRFDKRIVTFLTSVEVNALLAAPDQSRWEGRRDRVLMLLAVQTGLRVSELIGLNCNHVTLGTGASIRCEGKGRKQRAVPLSTPAAALLRSWLRERAGPPQIRCFPPAPAAGSAATPSHFESAPTPRPQPNGVHRWWARRSILTFFATAVRCRCSTPASIPP